MTIGFQISYDDPNTGQEYPTAWVVAKNNLLGDSTLLDAATSVLIQFDIYASEAAFETGLQPVVPNLRLRCVKGDGSEMFETYFADSVSQQMYEVYQCLQNYLSTLQLQ